MDQAKAMDQNEVVLMESWSAQQNTRSAAASTH
jgi:hypothetical protein